MESPVYQVEIQTPLDAKKNKHRHCNMQQTLQQTVTDCNRLQHTQRHKIKFCHFAPKFSFSYKHTDCNMWHAIDVNKHRLHNATKQADYNRLHGATDTAIDTNCIKVTELSFVNNKVTKLSSVILRQNSNSVTHFAQLKHAFLRRKHQFICKQIHSHVVSKDENNEITINESVYYHYKNTWVLNVKIMF